MYRILNYNRLLSHNYPVRAAQNSVQGANNILQIHCLQRKMENAARLHDFWIKTAANFILLQLNIDSEMRQEIAGFNLRTAVTVTYIRPHCGVNIKIYL